MTDVHIAYIDFTLITESKCHARHLDETNRTCWPKENDAYVPQKKQI